jgi:hypothetical protein
MLTVIVNINGDIENKWRQLMLTVIVNTNGDIEHICR